MRRDIRDGELWINNTYTALTDPLPSKGRSFRVMKILSQSRGKMKKLLCTKEELRSCSRCREYGLRGNLNMMVGWVGQILEFGVGLGEAREGHSFAGPRYCGYFW